LEATLAPAQSQEVLELDELWRFVRHRRHGVIWLWLGPVNANECIRDQSNLDEKFKNYIQFVKA